MGKSDKPIGNDFILFIAFGFVPVTVLTDFKGFTG
jgi:hypothetical protein